MVRSGIAIYGMDPFGDGPGARTIFGRSLSLRSYVAEVKPIAPGESAGYGRRFVAERGDDDRDGPVGYGDGWRRSLHPRRRRR